MDDQTIIFLLAAIMFAGALAFGYIPLGFRFSHARLEQFMALGAGVLVGSAFLVIIPEGLELTLGAAVGIAPMFLGGAILAGFTLMLLLEFFGLPHAVHHEADRELLSLSATIGLVIHASVDGLALGASVTSSTETGLIVFAAIMLHKGPTAFGLASFLDRAGTVAALPAALRADVAAGGYPCLPYAARLRAGERRQRRAGAALLGRHVPLRRNGRRAARSAQPRPKRRVANQLRHPGNAAGVAGGAARARCLTLHLRLKA